jgi:hypothetical protein
MEFYCFTCQDELFANLLMSKNDEHALDFAFHLPYLFQSSLNLACLSKARVWLMLSSPNTSLIIITLLFSDKMFVRDSVICSVDIITILKVWDGTEEFMSKMYIHFVSKGQFVYLFRSI